MRADRLAAIEEGATACFTLSMNGARNLVARRQIAKRMIVTHEGAAGPIDQMRAFASQRFCRQRSRVAANIDRGRMELHELRVGDQRAGVIRHGKGVALRGFRIGRDRIKPARSARAQDRLRRAQLKQPAGFFLCQHAGNAPIAVLQQCKRLDALNHLDVRGGGYGVGQRLHDGLASKVAGHTGDTRPRVGGLKRQGKLAIRRAIERHAKRQQVANARRPVFRDQARDHRINDARACCERVRCMQGWLVLRRERSRKATLRPGGCSGLAEWRQRDDGATSRRELQRKEKPSQPSADDEDVAIGRHGAVIRSGPVACGISREPGHRI